MYTVYGMQIWMLCYAGLCCLSLCVRSRADNDLGKKIEGCVVLALKEACWIAPTRPILSLSSCCCFVGSVWASLQSNVVWRRFVHISACLLERRISCMKLLHYDHSQWTLNTSWTKSLNIDVRLHWPQIREEYLEMCKLMQAARVKRICFMLMRDGCLLSPWTSPFWF